VLCRDVPAIRDPRRYGYADVAEHQAEAAAFAVQFLVATAAGRYPSGELATLDHYELLVPRTRTMARYFAMQPAFVRHPLRAVLTRGRAGQPPDGGDITKHSRRIVENSRTVVTARLPDRGSTSVQSSPVFPQQLHSCLQRCRSEANWFSSDRRL
jgi:hypothetical protein